MYLHLVGYFHNCITMHGFMNVKAVSLAVVLYGCETWSVTLWEERRMRVFENRVPVGPKTT